LRSTLASPAMRISAILFGAKFGSAPSLFRSSQKKLRRFVSTVRY
jgi:hypothetical protein